MMSSPMRIALLLLLMWMVKSGPPDDGQDPPAKKQKINDGDGKDPPAKKQKIKDGDDKFKIHHPAEKKQRSLQIFFKTGSFQDEKGAAGDLAEADAEVLPKLGDLFSSESDEDVKPKSRGGNLDRWGNPRKLIGGRPAADDMKNLTGTHGGHKTNKYRAGSKKKNLNILPEDQVKMAEWLEEAKKTYPHSQKGLEDFWKMALKNYPACDKDRLKKIMKNKDEMKKRCALKKRGHLADHIPNNAKPAATGIRADGGGIKIELLAFRIRRSSN